MMVHAPKGWGSAPLLLNQFSINFLQFNMVLMQDDFCRNLSARLYVFLFLCLFFSLLINTRLVLISYFVSVLLRKGHRSLEYQCSFIRLYLLLFAFLIVCIETFGFSQIFCNSSKHTLATLILLIVTNLFHEILLHHINVIFATIKTNYRNLIDPLSPLFFPSPRSI